MKSTNQNTGLRNRNVPLEMTPDEFRKVGHDLVDRIADFFATIPQRPVTRGQSAQSIRSILKDSKLPIQGSLPDQLLTETTDMLFDNSLFNGHPKFWGYITSSASPIGVLGDLLAAAVNSNVGAWQLSPMATEIEAQTIRWIAELIGYPTTCGGILVSGGNMANFVGFLAARKLKATWNIREEGLTYSHEKLVVYVSKETHTWIEKAVDLFGLGANSIRWISTNSNQQISLEDLENQIIADTKNDLLPFMVVGAAGTVSTGAVDPLPEIAAICRRHNLWFHVDGAYGAPAAALPEASDQLKGLAEADSVALDPHKWLYSPLEAGCILVRDHQHLQKAFSFQPEYYSFGNSTEEPPLNYYEFGFQNSRGFRALKVWLGLRMAGKDGYIEMIRDDISLAKALYRLANTHDELEAVTQNLSITTFRFIPLGLPKQENQAYLNELNEELLNRLQSGGEAFVSNAKVDGRYVLRACIVNFRTTLNDIEVLPGIIVRHGRAIDKEMR